MSTFFRTENIIDSHFTLRASEGNPLCIDLLVSRDAEDAHWCFKSSSCMEDLLESAGWFSKKHGLPMVDDMHFECAFEEIQTAMLDKHTRVGEGCGVKGYSDVDCAYIIGRSNNGKVVTVQYGTATLLNGFNSGEADALQFSPGGFLGHTEGRQRYQMAADPTGRVEKYSLRACKGFVKFVKVGESTQGGRRLLLGGAVHHYDYNF